MTYILDLSKALGEHGVEVEIITGDDIQKTVHESITENVSVTRLPMISVPLSRGSTDVIYRIIPKLFSTLVKSDADVINAHDYFHFSSDVSAWASIISGKPLVLTVHSKLGFFNVNWPIKMAEKVYNDTAGRFTLKCAKKVIFMSHSSREEFSTLGVSQDNGVVIHPSTDVDGFYQALNSFDGHEENFYSTRLGITDCKIIFSMGRTEERKGFQHLIGAVPRLIKAHPKLKVVIAGPDWGYAGELKKMVSSLGLENHVILPGMITDQELKEALFYADVFVLPSEHENYPQSMLKPAYLEKPIVASNTGGIPEFIEDGQTGLLVSVGDSDAIAQAILRLLNDEGMAKRLGKNAREKALKEGGTPQIAEKTINIFNEVLGV